MNFLHQGFSNLSSDIHTNTQEIQADRQRYGQTEPKLYTAVLCRWSTTKNTFAKTHLRKHILRSWMAENALAPGLCLLQELTNP